MRPSPSLVRAYSPQNWALSGPAATLLGMPGRDEITTYEQLQAMTPQERHEHFLASTVLDPADWRPNERALVQRLDELTLARQERLRGEAS